MAAGIAGNSPLKFWFALISVSIIPRALPVQFLIQAPKEFIEESTRDRGLLNKLDRAICAYDPGLTCATPSLDRGFVMGSPSWTNKAG